MTGDHELHQHGVERLCAAGERVYAEALRLGRLPRVAAEGASCLVDLGLLHPDVDDMEWLVPTDAGSVVAELLGDVQADLARAQQGAVAVAAALGRFSEVGGKGAVGNAIRILEGLPRIRAVLSDAAADCKTELLTVQPEGIRPEESLKDALTRDPDMARRGVRMRSLYTHSARHGLGLQAYLGRMGDVAEARTLEEVPERMVMFDRTVVFIPASVDRSVALEIRHPALIEYLATAFERFWRLATPMATALSQQTKVEGISFRDHSIAALLAEGNTDAEIAGRLGISVRTCRHHVSKLAEALGSSTRAQLGVRIVQAGLDAPPRPVGA